MAPPREDPIVSSSRREAAATWWLWLAALVYTMGYYALYGLDRDPERVRFVLGIPDWVLWGVLAPWAVCYLISLWFSYRFMQDADLGAERDDPAAGVAEGRDA